MEVRFANELEGWEMRGSLVLCRQAEVEIRQLEQASAHRPERPDPGNVCRGHQRLIRLSGALEIILQSLLWYEENETAKNEEKKSNKHLTEVERKPVIGL
jgi:hypothetical protein